MNIEQKRIAATLLWRLYLVKSLESIDWICMKCRIYGSPTIFSLFHPFLLFISRQSDSFLSFSFGWIPRKTSAGSWAHKRVRLQGIFHGYYLPLLRGEGWTATAIQQRHEKWEILERKKNPWDGYDSRCALLILTPSLFCLFICEEVQSNPAIAHFKGLVKIMF